VKATNLTDKQIGELRERAPREAGPFVNPRLVGCIRVHNAEWASEILGFPFPGNDRLPWPDLYLLHLAAQEEPAPPPPPLATARRLVHEQQEEQRRKMEAERYRLEVGEWERLKAALEEAGTEVTVRHNYTSHRHLDLYTQGGDHIYLRKPLHFGRLYRDAGSVLCWTPSRAKDLEHFPVEGEYDDRLPTCKACLKTACSIAERLTGSV
jgi:hypothetical protein